jgi:putative transcriptional regulator
MELEGKILVASPSLLDPNFHKSIILVVDHQKEEGTFGLVLNRPGPVSMELFCAGMGIDIVGDGEPAIHVGGPVQPGVGWLLHESLENAPDSRQVLDDVFISNSREMLERVASDAKIQHRVFVGYAGWGPHQLAQEMRAGAWFTTDADTSLVFFGAGETAWDKAMQNMGIDPRFLVPGSTELS